MRSMWKGAVSFGLVNVPVRLYTATQDHDIRFHQVHAEDGGRVRYKRTCTVCGKEVTFADIAKGYEADDGAMITLSDEDLATLPVSSGHEIDVVEFVGADEVDPMLLDRSYYLEPEAKAAKPYALLREALERTDRMAVVKIALRQRESLAVLRVRGKAIVLQTMLWPDEVRTPDFDILDDEIELRPQEVTMASSLVDSLTAEFDPTQFEDEYKQAVHELIEAKLEGGDVRQADGGRRADPGGDAEVIDLLAALQQSVDRAKGAAVSSVADSGQVAEGAASPTHPSAAKASSASKPSAKPRPSVAAKPATSKAAAGKKPAAKAATSQGSKRAAAPSSSKPTASKPTSSKPAATKSGVTKSANKKAAAKKPATKKAAVAKSA